MEETSMADEKKPEVVNLEQEQKPDVVVNTNLTDLLRKKEEEFNGLAQQIRQIDENIKKANEQFQAERNKVYTAAVEVQGTIKFLRDELAKTEKTEEKK